MGNNYYFDFITMEKIEIKDHLYLIGFKYGWRTADHTSNSIGDDFSVYLPREPRG